MLTEMVLECARGHTYIHTHTYTMYVYPDYELLFSHFVAGLFQEDVGDVLTVAVMAYANNEHDWTNWAGVCKRSHELVETTLDKWPGLETGK